MAGMLLLCGGEACPPVVHAPFTLGDDITANDVVCASYVTPAHQVGALYGWLTRGLCKATPVTRTVFLTAVYVLVFTQCS